ncbi:hypothetical protein [Paenibacillus herberti]|uniref:Uncharacterized protein n=1 Tax=Paenibacillus herberti TaxID=1619309 RepID=A0A229P0N7_9BACL|nr:hypothetical protein [Paenibacillus herberti]OXM15698.1 hypothetical protein CGZ75_02915 [Paenibacillus herberti]
MKTYLKLVHMEIYRFRFILGGLMALTAIVQLLGTQIFLSDRLKTIYESAAREGKSLGAEYSFPMREVYSTTEAWMVVPVIMCIVVISLYIFLIWYRDWFGKSTFAYRLLMLPYPRFTLYLSKFTALMVFIFSLLALQIIIVVLQMMLYFFRVPEELRVPVSLVDIIRFSETFFYIPLQLQEFLLLYGFGSVFVLLMFTTVLLERSYRLKGLIAGLSYTLVTFALVAWMWSMAESDGSFLFPSELLLVTIALMLGNTALSLWLGRWLLRTKVMV